MMLVTLTCHPAKAGAARHFTVKATDGRTLRVEDIIARNGREAMAAFRAMTTARLDVKEVA